MKRFLFLLTCCIGLSASAQDLTGIWRGNFVSNNTRLLEMLGNENRYKFEVQLDQQNKGFDGVTYSYLTTVFYGKASCKGTVNPKTKKVLLEELKIVEVRMSNNSSACIMTCFLQYSKLGDEEFLEGTYTSINVTDSTNCGRGTVFLRKVTTSDFYKEPFLLKHDKEEEKKPEIKKTDTAIAKTTTTTKPPAKKTTTITKAPVKKTTPSTTPPKNNLAKKLPVKTIPEKKPSGPISDPKIATIDTIKKLNIKPAPVVITPRVLASRENELVKTIITRSNEIVINIYDNGSIDNDTVSVYLDKKLVLSKKRLTDKPLTLKFALNDDQNFHELVMVAENLGEIPPNTSLMVVNAGNRQYEVRITSTEQKNAVVIFKYDKDKKE